MERGPDGCEGSLALVANARGRNVKKSFTNSSNCTGFLMVAWLLAPDCHVPYAMSAFDARLHRRFGGSMFELPAANFSALALAAARRRHKAMVPV